MNEEISPEELVDLEDVLRSLPLERGIDAHAPLRRSDLDDDPLVTFADWMRAALEVELHPPNAMTLATASADGRPSARVVLLKGATRDGFVFFTNHDSRKGADLSANPRAALVFYWPVGQRQVRVVGSVERLDESESYRYFSSRPRGKRIAAWASQQSAPIASRAELEERVAAIESRFPSDDIPLPDFWGGYRVVPDSIEFWQGHPDRLHDRFLYTRSGDAWEVSRLSP